MLLFQCRWNRKNKLSLTAAEGDPVAGDSVEAPATVVTSVSLSAEAAVVVALSVARVYCVSTATMTNQIKSRAQQRFTL